MTNKVSLNYCRSWTDNFRLALPDTAASNNRGSLDLSKTTFLFNHDILAMALHIIEVPEHKINVLNEFPKMQGDTPTRGKALWYIIWKRCTFIIVRIAARNNRVWIYLENTTISFNYDILAMAHHIIEVFEYKINVLNEFLKLCGDTYSSGNKLLEPHSSHRNEQLVL